MADALDADQVVARQGIIGQSLGERYEVLRLLSSGGSGDVYEVKHRELQKIFAAKVLRLGPNTTPDLLKRFQREAQILCRLKNESVVYVHAFGIDAKAGPYLIMDYIEGDTLSQCLSERKLSVDQSLNFFAQICAGLTAAHEAGIVHRDIKPTNVMIVGTGASARAILIDFGAGKLMQQDGQKLTQTDMLFGTPLYMSPEQCSSGEVDERSDIYSFGCLMYEVLTGNPPFSGDTALEILTKQIGETAKNPSEVNPNVPRYMDAIIANAMAKRREDRYQKASALLLDLQNKASSITPRMGKSVIHSTVVSRRPKVKPYLVSLLSLVILGGLSVGAWYLSAKLAPRSISEYETLRDQAWSKGDLTQAFDYGSKVIEYYDALRKKLPAARANTDECADQYYKMALIEDALGHVAEAKTSASVAFYSSVSPSRSGPYELYYADNLFADRDYDSAETLYKDLLRTDSVELWEKCQAQVHYGQILMAKGNYPGAERQFKDVMAYHSISHLMTAMATECLARCCSDTGRYDRAAHWFSDAMPRYVTLGKKVPPTTRGYYALNEARRKNFSLAQEQIAKALKHEEQLIAGATCPGDKLEAEKDLKLVQECDKKIKDLILSK